MNNYEKIKSMTIEEMADFLESCVSDERTHDIGCYQCINYGTHYWTDGDCNDCEQYNIGLDVKKWLEAKCIKDGYMEDEDN